MEPIKVAERWELLALALLRYHQHFMAVAKREERCQEPVCELCRGSNDWAGQLGDIGFNYPEGIPSALAAAGALRGLFVGMKELRDAAKMLRHIGKAFQAERFENSANELEARIAALMALEPKEGSS